MPLVDKIEKYTVSIFHNDIVDYDRSIRLSLESGGTAQILFPATRPQDWLQFSGPNTAGYSTRLALRPRARCTSRSASRRARSCRLTI